ncbi:hypothetical protein ACFOLG_02770 [Vogesella facilis]|uniref:Uncharacterized protein n=1 Tax=Vogesella facilis TaxID=1655232 RepID=A0ABV7RCT0_9NEIS
MQALILLAPCLIQLWFFLHTADAPAGRARLAAPLLYVGLPLVVLLYGRYGMAAAVGMLPRLVNFAGLAALACGALLLPPLLRRRRKNAHV